MLQLGCSSPSHMSSTPASPNLFSPMCSTFKCLFTLRAELTALQQVVVRPHSLILQGKSDMRSRWGNLESIRHCSLLYICFTGAWTVETEEPKSSHNHCTHLNPPVCSILSKQHLSHSLYLGHLSRSVHLGKALVHKAQERSETSMLLSHSLSAPPCILEAPHQLPGHQGRS